MARRPRVNVVIGEPTYQALKRLAEADHRSLSQYCELVLAEHALLKYDTREHGPLEQSEPPRRGRPPGKKRRK